MKPSRRTAVSLLLVVGLALVAVPVRADLSKSDRKCLAATAKAVQDFALARLKALQKCRESAADPSITQCPDEKATSKIEKATAKLNKALAKKKCGSAKFDPSNLGFTGCPAIGECEGSTATVDDYRTCVGCAAGEVVDSLATAESPGACGNGSVDAGEACDGGGESATCDANCTAVECGDGAVNATAGEACEKDADCGSGGTCQADCTCTVITCNHNDKVDPGEECDGTSGQCEFGACTSECLCPPCDCCATGKTLLRFETGLASGTAGKLQNFRCSNANTVACVDDADCDLGYCAVPFNKCSGNFGVVCTKDADCAGTCAEQTGSGLPLDLVLGGLYTGGGKNSVPLPLPVPDKGTSWTRVIACNGDTMTLGPTTPAEAGQVGCTTGRTCSSSGTTCVLDSDCPAAETCVTNCIFGPQLPIPNSTPGSEATSVCTINDVGGDAGGATQCTGGDSTVTVKLRSVVYLNGDLLSSSTGPVDVPGIQPCPVCTRQCVGGAHERMPCTDDSECDSGTCSAGTSCLGGTGNGNACTADTSGADVLGAAFPTSHDCSMDANQIITGSIGGLPVDLTLTTGSIVIDAVDQPNGTRTFSGFCRDVDFSGSLCFEGDPSTTCPTVGDSNGVPCSSDADCTTPEYESCAQTNPGAFSKAAATRISAAGSTDGGCLADGQPHATNVVSVFDIAPTFNGLVDSAGDIPGPGAALLTGEALLTDTVQ